MKVTDFILNSEQICGNSSGQGKLLSVTPAYEYVNGKATTNIIGYKYLVVFETNNFEKVRVKVIGKEPVITNEELKQNQGFLTVVFHHLVGRFYRGNMGEYLLSASAEGVEVIDNELDI